MRNMRQYNFALLSLGIFKKSLSLKEQAVWCYAVWKVNQLLDSKKKVPGLLRKEHWFGHSEKWRGGGDKNSLKKYMHAHLSD